MIAPLPDRETQRIQALRRYENSDRSANAALDDLTRLAAQLCQTPIAAINLVDKDRCSVKSHVGWENVEAEGACTFCIHTTRQRQLVIVRDTESDYRFAPNSLAIAGSNIRFYAGFPLIASEGYALGTLCVMDRVPRDLSEAQIEALQTLAHQVMALLELHWLQVQQKHQPQVPDLFELTHDLIQTVRLSDRRFVYANKSWLQTLGYSKAEVNCLSWHEILDPECYEQASLQIEKLRQGETLEGIELILLSKMGDRLWVEGNLSCRWENGQPYSITGIFRNITAEKQGRLKYQLLFDNIALGLFQIDISGRYVQVNSALADSYGFDSPADFLSRVEHISQLYLDPNEWVEYRLQLQTEGQIEHEVEVRRPDGSLIWVLEEIWPLRDPLGRVVGYEGCVQDLTRSKQAEATIQMARDQLQAVLDAVPGTVSLISANFRYLGVNRHLAATYNLPASHFVGREVGFRQSVFGQFVRQFFMNQAEEASIEIDSEVNGNFRSDLVIAKKWLEDEAAVFVGIDITERKRAEAALKAELAEAAEYVRSLLPLPFNEPVAVDSRFIPSQQLGGDCFDYYWLDEDHLAIYLLDVSGHGSRAALLSVSVLNLLRSRFLPDTNFYQPREVLMALNQAIQMERQRNMYFTIWYGVYNKQKREIVYSCAGHPPALLISKTSPDTCSVHRLRTSSSLPIGMFRNIEYSDASCQVDELSTLYIFSDGIYEICQPDGTLWNLDDFIDLLVRLNQPDSFSLEKLLQEVRTYRAKDAFEDDVSILQVKF